LEGSFVYRWLNSEQSPGYSDGSGVLRFLDRFLQELLSAFKSSMLAKAVNDCLADFACRPVYYLSVFVLFYTLASLIACWFSEPALDFWFWLKIAVMIMALFGLKVKAGFLALKNESIFLKKLLH